MERTEEVILRKAAKEKQEQQEQDTAAGLRCGTAASGGDACGSMAGSAPARAGG